MLRVPRPERDSIFGDTYNGVPTPNTIIEHGYPTRFHGPVLTMPMPGYKYKGRPYAKASFMGVDGMGSYPGYHRVHRGLGQGVEYCMDLCTSLPDIEQVVKCQEDCAYASVAPPVQSGCPANATMSPQGVCLCNPGYYMGDDLVCYPHAAPEPEPAPAPAPAPFPGPAVTPAAPGPPAGFWASRSNTEKALLVGGGLVLAAVGVAKLAKPKRR
jgi:hypothetical protein